MENSYMLNKDVILMQTLELQINKWMQENLQDAEPLWMFLSEYLTPTLMIDVLIPFVGFFKHTLLVRLICSIGILNALSSLMKWTSPEYRPFWFIPEVGLNNTHFKQFPQTCETTGGLPSNHVMAFTAFMYMLVWSGIPAMSRRLRCSEGALKNQAMFLLLCTTTLMWISRLYLGTQFFHQCLVGSFMALTLLHIFHMSGDMYKLIGKDLAIPIVIAYALIPIAVYYTKLQADIDPHWSVRMAFKWCSDPSYLRHETTPIFLLARDAGYLMGVAMAIPVPTDTVSMTSPRKRFAAFVGLATLNYWARVSTPKQHGRYIFIVYEFLRNLMHSFGLLKVIPRIS